MDVSDIISKNKKNIRKLNYLWNGLINRKNFCYPETIDEFKTFNFFSPKVSFQKRDWYFKEKSRKRLVEFLNTLYEIPEINISFSYHTVYIRTIKYINKALYLKLIKNETIDPQNYIKQLVKHILKLRKKYIFIRTIEGIDIKEIKSFHIADIEISIYSEEYEQNFMDKYREFNNENNYFDISIIPYIRKNYSDKVCILATANGDREKAEEISLRKIKRGINVIRFLFCCVGGYKLIDRNAIKINLFDEAYHSSEKLIFIDDSTKTIGLSIGTGRKVSEKFILNSNKIKDIKEHYFYNDIEDIILKDKNRNELEDVILSSIYWVGEAQNELDTESAFLKYWTALETIFFNSENDGSTESIAKGISALICGSGYTTVSLKDIDQIYTSAKKLYKKRSKIIHRGKQDCVLPKELNEVCKYATWSTLSLFSLRAVGHKELKKLKNQFINVYETYSTKKEDKNIT